MPNPLKSVLITDWSPQHITGHDLDGGEVVTYNLDTTLVGTEALGHDQARWNAGDIATLRIAAGSNLAELRIVTARQYVLRVREFRIVDITHTVADGRPKENGHHIFMQGMAENGVDYVLPMLGYTAWTDAWDMTSLETALTKLQTHKDASPIITCESLVQTLSASDENFSPTLRHYKDIFYPDCKNDTPFENVTSLTTASFTLHQSGPETSAYMYVAAFIKKTSLLPIPGIDQSANLKRGTAFSPPYFKIGGEKVFIRTSSGLRTNVPVLADCV